MSAIYETSRAAALLLADAIAAMLRGKALASAGIETRPITNVTPEGYHVDAGVEYVVWIKDRRAISLVREERQAPLLELVVGYVLRVQRGGPRRAHDAVVGGARQASPGRWLVSADPLTLRHLASLGTRLAASIESLKAARRLARELRKSGEIGDTVLYDIERSLHRAKLVLAELGLQLAEREASAP